MLCDLHDLAIEIMRQMHSIFYRSMTLVRYLIILHNFSGNYTGYNISNPAQQSYCNVVER